MKIKVATFHSALALFIAVGIGFLYLHEVAIPVFEGDSNIYAFYTGDAFLYMNPSAQEDAIGKFVDFVKGTGTVKYAFTRFNVLGMALLGKFALWLDKENAEYIVFLINICVLIVAIRNYQYIFTVYNVSRYRLFLFYFFLNPIVIMGLVFLNKEIWGVFLLSAFVRYRISRKYWRYVLTVIIAFIIRDIYAIVGILYFLLSTVKISRLYYLVFISLLAPFIVSQKVVEYYLIGGQDERSLGFTLLLNSIQSVPLGYMLAYFPKLVLSMFAGLSPSRFFDVAIWNWVAIYTKVSCLLFLILTCTILHKRFSLKRTLNRDMVNLFFAYTLAVCPIPFIHHRYIFPVYPILILTALLSFRKMPVEAKPVVATEFSTCGSCELSCF